jgi:TolB-like protein
MLESGHAVLADFGVAHAAADAKDERITRNGMSPGTPAYMSPEQAAGGRDLDGRSDQYALGCVLFEMLSGEAPFTGPTPAAILARHVGGQLPSLTVVRPNLPKGLVKAVEKSLAKVPADRHQTSTAFMKAIVQGATGDVSAAPPPGRIGAGRLVAAASLVLVAAFGAYQIITRWTGNSADEGGTLARVAVTYFDDLSEGGELDWLADALTVQVAEGIRQLGVFFVFPDGAMKPYQGVGLTADALEALDIDAYVTGSVMGDLDRTTVSVELINAADLSHIASDIVQGDVDSPSTLLDGLAREISGLLREWLGIRLEMLELQAGTESGAAWTLVQRARRRFNDGRQLQALGDTAAATRTLIEADSILEQAEAEDPSYLTPIVDRGWVAAELARMGTSTASFDTTWTRVGISHADRALRKAPDDPRALEVRGILLDYLASESDSQEAADSLWAEAVSELRRATALDESRSGAFARLSRIFEHQGRDAEANVAAGAAYKADPFQMDARTILYRLCSTSLSLQLWEEVALWCEEGRDRFPDRPGFPSAELTALAGPVGPPADPNRAWVLSDTVLALLAPQEGDRRVPTHHLQVAAVLARAGLPDSARAVMDRALSYPVAVRPLRHAYEANVRLQLGEVDGALVALQRFLEAVPAARAEVAKDWWWEKLWDHPRFKELVDPPGSGSGPAYPSPRPRPSSSTSI